PIVDLRFGRGRPDNAVLGDGWEEAESDAVRMAEQQARLRLTAPYVPGDHVLLVDVSVDGGDRQVVEITNETGVVLRQSIVGRSTVRGLLPRASHSAVVSLNITFSAEERQAPPFEKTTAPRIAVHRVGIAIARSVARGGYASAADLIAATNAHRSGGRKHEILRSAEGFRPVALPGGRTGLPIVTTFGTRVYWDEVVGEVRHGRSGAVPENLVLAEHGDFGVLCHRSLDRKQDRIVIRPEGSLASTDAWIPWTGGYIHTFELLRRQTAAGMRFGLRGGCLYLCAEPDGSITLSRPHWNAWETFGFQA
ncbi:MAG: hypothetical protein JSS43_33185, partial [Proteobacteria bacterium]|nr:hypothetical protein [Pseudomonadota bacterium]